VTQVTTAGSDTHMHDSGRIVGNPEINVGIRTGSVMISRHLVRKSSADEMRVCED
jgi:hypothetical protein